MTKYLSQLFFAMLYAAFFLSAFCIAHGAQTDADSSPWGLASSAHSTYTNARWFPKVSAAGVTWIRSFADWTNIEPERGKWNWVEADGIVQSADANHLKLCGLFGYSPDWAHDTAAQGAPFPMTHLEDWSAYIDAVAERYKGRVPCWEIWNEPNGNFKGRYPDGRFDTANDYAKLAVRAYESVKKADPSAEIGLTCASLDLPYLSSTIQAEAALGKPGAFDFICIHPYEVLGGLSEEDGEIPYLWMGRLTHEMLAASAPNKADADIWITEVSRPIGEEKESGEADFVTPELSAETMVKAYVMAIAEGIKRVCWFEGQSPMEESAAYGILDREGRARPAFVALKTLISRTGESPRYVGWLAIGTGGRGYGFVFEGPSGPVLVAWMPKGMTSPLTCNGKRVSGDEVDLLTGKVRGSGTQRRIGDAPVLMANMSADLVAEAKANRVQDFPWGGNFAGAQTASITLGAQNDDRGLIQVERGWTQPHVFADGSTGAVVSPPGKHDWQNIKFMTHPSFSNVMTRTYDIRVTARRLALPKSPTSFAGMNLVYERADSQGGNSFRTAEWRMLDLGKDGWQAFTWHITDAAFSKMWGYDIAFSIGKSDPFVIGRVEVSDSTTVNSN